MANLLQIGPLRVRKACSDTDIQQCQALRHRAFLGRDGLDVDAFDPVFEHLMFEQDGVLMGTVRYRVLTDESEIAASYTGQYYDIRGVPGSLIELGRLCLTKDAPSADVLRLIWAVITQEVDRSGAQWLFGCSSFSGTDMLPYGAACRQLVTKHLISDDIQVAAQATDVVDIRRIAQLPDLGKTPMPQMLRSYVAMGGKVNDTAIVDRHLGTMHLCTLLRIADIPQRRVDTLRALVSNQGLQ